MNRAACIIGVKIIACAMVHIFFGSRRNDKTPADAESAITHPHNTRSSSYNSEVASAFENWQCDICAFENRALRSTSARKSARTCSNCNNDFIFKISSRKHAHKALIEERPVQVR